MPTNTNVTNLKINTLTKAQYDTAVQGGVIGANEISIITDLDDSIQVATMPTAAAGEEGKIYQYIGTTDANYTNGYFYKCVSDGATPAVYSWEAVEVQASSGGLPSQTGQSGKFLTTDGTNASWSDITKVNMTITLAAADWSSNTQTVTVNGVTSTSVVFVAPDPADITDYVSAGILCTAQGTNSLTFTATTTPSTDIDVVVVAM